VRSNHPFGFVNDNANELKVDLALVCDTSMWTIDADGDDGAARPGPRGAAATCADRDLHSGLFGGAAQNPLRVSRASSLRCMMTTAGRFQASTTA
jgi:hypothetical protein